MNKKAKKTTKLASNKFDILRNIKILLLSLFSYLLLFWLFPVYSFIGLYIVVGIMIGSLAASYTDAFFLGSTVGLLSGIFSSIYLTTEKFIYYFQTMPNSIVNRDVPMSLYGDVFYNLVVKNPIAYLGKPLYILLTTTLICIFSVLFSTLTLKKIGIYLFLSIMSINFLFVSINSGKSIINYSSTEPGYFAYDGIFYLKTLYLLDREPFYRAYIMAHKYDSRDTIPNSIVNYQVKTMGGPFNIREPYIYYFWKFIAQGDMRRVIYFSVIFSSFLIFFSYFAIRHITEDYSFAAPIIITPFLFTGTTWINVFFSDWWTALFLLAGIFFWINKKYLPSALFILSAVLTREVISIAFLLFVFYAVFRKKQAAKPFIFVTIIFAILFGIHYYYARSVIYPGAAPSFEWYLDRFKHPSFTVFTAGASWMMFLYGFFKMPFGFYQIIFIILPLAAAFASFIKKYYELSILSLYTIFHNFFHSSTYWGEHFTLITLFIVTFMLNINLEDIKKINLFKKRNIKMRK